MKLLKKITRKNLSGLILLMIFLISASATAAQDKIVVIPLFDDQSGPPPDPQPIAKTGQTQTYAAGDDGDLQMGESWPAPRFIDNGDGTVTDALTNLIWLRTSSCGPPAWADTLQRFCEALHDGWTGDGSGGDCGLSDGSFPGDWRMPTAREMLSLVDYSMHGPALPSGHPFTGDFGGSGWFAPQYFTSTQTFAECYVSEGPWCYDRTIIWNVSMETGAAEGYTCTLPNRYCENEERYVWPVRNAHD